MLKRRWRHLLALLLLIVIAVGLLLWSRPAPQASLDHRQLPDGSAASLAPFTYGQILTATLIGALAFDHLPDTWAVLGMAVIMLSGAALAWSQNRK